MSGDRQGALRAPVQPLTIVDLPGLIGVGVSTAVAYGLSRLAF